MTLPPPAIPTPSEKGTVLSDKWINVFFFLTSSTYYVYST